MSRMYKTHPKLFLAIIFYGVFNLSLGVGFLIAEKIQPIDWFLSFALTMLGISTIIGAFIDKSITDVTMAISIGLGIMQGVGLAIGLWKPHPDLQFIFWEALALIAIALVTETDRNPLMEHKDDPRE